MKNFVKEKWSDVVLGAVFVVSGFVKAVDPGEKGSPSTYDFIETRF